MMIKEVSAVYTGGNIWLFWGRLNDGNWFLTDDDGCTLILTESPEDFDESLYEEWQKKHLVKELAGDERVSFCNSLCDVLLMADDDHKGGITDEEIEAYREWFRQ